MPVASIAAAVYIGWEHFDVAAISLAVIADISALLVGRLAAQTPAIVGADDPTTDMLVDGKVRGSRIRQLLTIATYCPIILIFASTKPSSMDPIIRLMFTLSFLLTMLWSQKAVRFTKRDVMQILDSPMLNPNGGRA
jgi:hypothetical protein